MNTDSNNLKKFADSIVQKYPEVSRLIYWSGVFDMPYSSTPSSTMQGFNTSIISRIKSILTVRIDLVKLYFRCWVSHRIDKRNQHQLYFYRYLDKPFYATFLKDISWVFAISRRTWKLNW
jgi:hypothetical protein